MKVKYLPKHYNPGIIIFDEVTNFTKEQFDYASMHSLGQGKSRFLANKHEEYMMKPLPKYKIKGA